MRRTRDGRNERCRPRGQPRSFQFSRTSAPIVSHFVYTIFGPNDGASVSGRPAIGVDDRLVMAPIETTAPSRGVLSKRLGRRDFERYSVATANLPRERPPRVKQLGFSRGGSVPLADAMPDRREASGTRCSKCHAS